MGPVAAATARDTFDDRPDGQPGRYCGWLQVRRDLKKRYQSLYCALRERCDTAEHGGAKRRRRSTDLRCGITRCAGTGIPGKNENVEPKVEIRRLCKRFGQITAVDDVSFGVGRGEVLGFLGPNGAGKSTTMKMITGFLAPDSGSVIVGGDDIALAPVAVKARIGYLPEGAPLYGDMTPLAFLNFVAEIRGFRGEEKRARIEQTVQRVNLEQVLNQPIATLSKGFKRRVGLAQAILHDPEVLILDEPTDGLDPNQKHEVRALIRSMAQAKVIILSTHILEEVEAVCTRAIIIARGKIVCDSTPAELEARSRLHNAITLAVKGDGAHEAAQSLRDLSEVEAVELLGHIDGIARYQIYPKAGELLAATVSQVARARGWEIVQLTVERGRLDEVFRAVTTGESASLEGGM